MKSIAVLLSILLCLHFTGYCQTTSLRTLVAEGVQLHEKGDYEGAIVVYEKALALDRNSPLVNYELSMTYFAMKDFSNAIKFSDKVLAEKKEFMDMACVVKGSAQDLMGLPKQAVKTYQSGIKWNPQNNMLYFNLAVTYYNLNQLKDAEEAIQKGLRIKSTHASSHLLIGQLMADQGQRCKSLLALFNFLILEPVDQRATTALAMIDEQLKRGVTQESTTKINISLDPGNDKDDFRMAEVMMSLLIAGNYTEKNEGKSAAELFVSNTTSLISLLQSSREKNKGFWWEYYVDYFNDMQKAGHTEAFCYYISRSKPDKEIASWLAENEPKMTAFYDWSLNQTKR